MSITQKDIEAVSRPINLASHTIAVIQKYWRRFAILLAIFIAIGVSIGLALDPVKTVQFKFRAQPGPYSYNFQKITIPTYWQTLVPSNFADTSQERGELSDEFLPVTLFSNTMDYLNNMVHSRNFDAIGIDQPIVSLREKKRENVFVLKIGGRVSAERLRVLANNMINTATDTTKRVTNEKAQAAKTVIIDTLQSEYKLRNKAVANVKEREKYQTELAVLDSYIKFLQNSQDQIEFNPVHITSDLELKSSNLLRWVFILSASLMLALLAILAFIAALYVQRLLRTSEMSAPKAKK